MSSVKADHITGQQSAHQGRQGNVAGSEKKMGVIGHESPGVAGDPALGQKKRKRSIRSSRSSSRLNMLRRSVPRMIT